MATKKKKEGQVIGEASEEIKEKATPQTMEEVLASYVPKIQEILKKLPSDKFAAAQKEAQKLMGGDLSWADLTQYTPERLLKIAEIGYNQFQIGNYESAERIFKGLTVIDPQNYYHHQMLGATFQRKEKQAEALLEYSVAIDLNPQDVVSLTNRGEVYVKMGIPDLAKDDFEKAIQMDPKEEDRWANRARMLLEQIKLMKTRKK